MSVRIKLIAAAGLATLVSTPAFALNETFDNPLTLSNTQAAGAWYTDRYAPEGFAAQSYFDGDNRLKVSIDASDSLANRSAPYNSAFYNTQGRKLDLDAGTKVLSVDLYISADWASGGQRRAGLWASGVPANLVGGITYPILEFASDGAGARFQLWDSGSGWVDLGLPGGFSYDSWYTLSFVLDGGQVKYKVGDISGSISSYDAATFDNVILQAYNAGTSYDVYWDNLHSAVPEPASWAMMIGGFAIAGAAMRRKKVATRYA